MNQEYYDAVTKMEEMNVDPEYVQGWQGGYLLNPEREEQRVNEAYSAGYEDGKAHNTARGDFHGGIVHVIYLSEILGFSMLACGKIVCQSGVTPGFQE